VKNYKLVILSLLITSFSVSNGFSQDKVDLGIGFNLNIGFTKPILDFAPGINLGANYFYNINNRFGIEGQISYTYLDYENADLGFFSQNGGDLRIINAMVGGRVYLNNIETRKHPIYVNLITGYGWINQNEYNSNDVLVNTKTGSISTSLGIHIAFNRKITLGLAVDAIGDSASNMILKLGYNF
jgi:hypothetical protein